MGLCKGESVGVGGDFVVGDKLGAGGFGHVYAVQGRHSEERFALKYYANYLGKDVQRTVLRALSLRTEEGVDIKSDHFVTALGCGYVKDRFSVLMNFVDGVEVFPDSELSLTHHSIAMQERGKNVEDVIEYIRKAGAIIEILIEHGLVHRDVKSENFLKKPDGSYALLDLDFLVRAGEVRRGESLMFGTLPYSPPECYRLKGSVFVDTHDVYSLAANSVSRLFDDDFWYKFAAGWDLTMTYEWRRFLVVGAFSENPAVRRRVWKYIEEFPDELRPQLHGVAAFALEAMSASPAARPKSMKEIEQLLAERPPRDPSIVNPMKI